MLQILVVASVAVGILGTGDKKITVLCDFARLSLRPPKKPTGPWAEVTCKGWEIIFFEEIRLQIWLILAIANHVSLEERSAE